MKGDLQMDSVEIARLLTGMTLAVHIIFATIGVGMPLMFAIAEFIGIKKMMRIILHWLKDGRKATQ